MLQVERHLESLRVAILSNLRDLGAGGHVDIVDLVFNYQIWEVHVNLRYNLLSLEVVDCEPKALTLEVAIWVFACLSEYQWSLSAIVVFEFNSFVDNSPCLILRNYFTLLVSWNSSLNLELEQLNTWLRWTNHLISVRVENVHARDSWQQVLTLVRQKSLVLHEQVLFGSNLKERLTVLRLPITALDQGQLRRLGWSHLVDLCSQVGWRYVVGVEQAEWLYLQRTVIIAHWFVIIVEMHNSFLAPGHVFGCSRNYHLLTKFVIKLNNIGGKQVRNRELFLLQFGIELVRAELGAW